MSGERAEAWADRLRKLLGTSAEVGDEDCLREVQHVRELAQRLYPVAIGGGWAPPPLATHLEWAVDAARKAERALTIQTATELYASMAQTKAKEPEPPKSEPVGAGAYWRDW